MIDDAFHLMWAPAPPIDTLSRDEAQVFAFPLDRPAHAIGAFAELLDDDERTRAHRFRRAHDRERYIVGRGELRSILGAYLGHAPDTITLSYGTHGKPRLKGGREAARVRFNLSRSHGLAVLVIQPDDDIGIDIERIRPFSDALAVARRFFAPVEYAALSRIPADGVDHAFFSYWTRKEAIIKSIGTGLSHPMDVFVLAPDPRDGAETVTIPGAASTPTHWCRLLPPPAVGFMVAVSAAGRLRPLNWWSWDDTPPRVSDGGT